MRGAKFLILISAILLGCSSGADRLVNADGLTVIDVGSDVGKGRVVNLSEIASDIIYIPLETNEDSFIASMPVIFLENDRIYVKSRRVIKVFDMSGKYLFTFDRKGRGPQEYSYSGPNVERGTGRFYAENPNSDRSVTVKLYSQEGDFVKEFIAPSVKNRILRMSKSKENVYSFTFINDFIPQVDGIEVDTDKVSKLLLDSLANIIGFLPELPIDSRVVLGTDVRTKTEDGRELLNPFVQDNTPQVYHFYKDTIRIYKQYNDTLYSFYDGNKLVPRYVLDYGVYAASKIDLDQLNYLEGKVISVDNSHYYETDRFIMLSFLLRDYAHEPFFGKYFFHQVKEREVRESYALYNKLTGEFSFLNLPLPKTPGFREDFEQGPPFLPSYLSEDSGASGNGYMVSLVYTGTLKEHAANHNVSDKLRAIVDGLDENDNPVLVLVKLR
jgi:hypothetical protein